MIKLNKKIAKKNMQKALIKKIKREKYYSLNVRGVIERGILLWNSPAVSTISTEISPILSNALITLEI